MMTGEFILSNFKKNCRLIVILIAVSFISISYFSGRAFSIWEKLDEMRIIFFPSAAYFHFPDGGNLLIDIGKGVDEKVVKIILKDMVGGEAVYRILSAFGWRPRMDWLIITSRSGEWDNKIMSLLNRFSVTNAYVLPYADNKKKESNRVGFHKGVDKVLLQLSLEGQEVLKLGNSQSINLFQSISRASFHKILPLDSVSPEEDGGSAVCFLVVYGDVRILVSGELTLSQQRLLIDNFSEQIKADIYYHPPNLTNEFLSYVGASWTVPFDGSGTRLRIDGRKIIKEEKQ